jgi:hypothetical protein
MCHSGGGGHQIFENPFVSPYSICTRKALTFG